MQGCGSPNCEARDRPVQDFRNRDNQGASDEVPQVQSEKPGGLARRADEQWQAPRQEAQRWANAT